MAEAGIDDLRAEIERFLRHLPNDGVALWKASSRINFLWFRDDLPECKAHDTINAIDSEGEDYFTGGSDPSPDPAHFYSVYADHFSRSLKEMHELLREISKSSQ